MQISFSIIMPTYNRKNCIKNAIDSLLAQTYQSFELIIIDDGSNDNTEEYLQALYEKELNDKKIRYILLPQNKGAAFARNEGLKMAKNKWIGYLDTDNHMRPYFLEAFADNIDKNEDCEAFYAQIKHVGSGNVVGKVFDFDELIHSNFIDLGVFIHSAKVYNLLGGFDAELKRLIDWDLIIKYTEKYKPVFLSKVLLDYYDGSDIVRITNSNSHDENYKKVVMGHFNRISSRVFAEEYLKYSIEFNNKKHELNIEIKKNQNLISELEYLKESNFWKLRGAYLEMKYVVFSPHKIFKKYLMEARGFLGYKVREILKQKLDIIIIDDYFPNLKTAFRIAEYNYYLDKFSNSVVINKKFVDGVDNNFEHEHDEYASLYPQFSDRVLKYDNKSIVKAKLLYTVFLNNIYYYLPIIEEFKINFVFTLYPGGGFWINNDPEIDRRLSLVFKSPYFKKVIVTQKITYDYLIENNLCPAEKIEFIFGVVLDSEYYKQSYVEKKYYKKDKETFDVCFVAYKYMEKGIDKGYDTFIETAKKLLQISDDFRFHVVGGFDENDIDIREIKEGIVFHGALNTSKFPEFYSKMDMIISPTVPFKLFPGNFDGFPTGSCSEAAFAGVAVLCSDELHLNTEFKDKEDIRIIPNDAEEISKIVQEYLSDSDSLYKLSEKGRKSFLRVYDINKQMSERMRILNEFL